MAVAEQVRRTQSLWTLLEEIRPETTTTSRREPSGRFRSRIEGIIAGLEELTILREIHRRLVREATAVAAKTTTPAVVTSEEDDKTMQGLADGDRTAAEKQSSCTSVKRERSDDGTDNASVSPPSGLAGTSNSTETQTQDGVDKSTVNIPEVPVSHTNICKYRDDKSMASTQTTVVFRKRLNVPGVVANRKQRWRHSDGHLVDDEDIVTKVGTLLKQPRQLCMSGSTFQFPSPMHAVMLQYQGLSTRINVYADPVFDIVTSSTLAGGQQCETAKQLRRSASNAAIVEPKPHKTPKRSASLFNPRSRLPRFNFKRRATTTFSSVLVQSQPDVGDRTLCEQCLTPTNSDVSLVRSCSDASSWSPGCYPFRMPFDEGKMACMRTDIIRRKAIAHTGSLRSDVSYGSTGSSHPDASSSDEDRAPLSPASNASADIEERTAFAWDFISCSLESFAEMRDTDV